MEQKKFIMLMVGLTKGGKTTIARTLCSMRFREIMSKLCNFRTQVSVDWTYDVSANTIRLEDVSLNYKSVFGTEIEEDINSDRFNEILNSKDGEYLRKTFSLEEQQPECTPEELKDYVKGKINDYVKSNTIEGLSNLIKNRKSSRFIRRIKVIVPPEDSFSDYLRENGISFVLRDTRGMLDMDSKEAEDIKYRTMEELGIDGIDAVLLLGTSHPFPDITGWYKKPYEDAFQSVPVFIMLRRESLDILFEQRYGETDGNNISIANVKDFLEAIKRGQEKEFKNLAVRFRSCYELLENFNMGHMNGNEFVYDYEVYNNEDLRYVYPESETLTDCAKPESEPDYNAHDYKLYEMIVHENIKDMISKMIEHHNIRDAIFENMQINSDFLREATKGMKVYICPNYKKYGADEVYNDILKGGEILGPRNGITTVYDNELRYLGALTSAISSREWLMGKAYAYEYKGSLKNPDGTDLIKDMPEKCQRNLIRMFILKMIEDYTDQGAYYQGYYFMNRFIVKNAIDLVRRSPEHPKYPDALTETTAVILKSIF